MMRREQVKLPRTIWVKHQDNSAKLIRSARLFPNEQDIDDLKKSVDPNRIGYFDMKSFVDVGMEFSYKQA